jgi:hypothetical protein
MPVAETTLPWLDHSPVRSIRYLINEKLVVWLRSD